MHWRNFVCALVGLWFVLVPWMLDMSMDVPVIRACVTGGTVLFAVSIWSMVENVHPAYQSLPNWISFAAGFWFMFVPFMAHFEIWQYWAVAAPGLAVIALNLWSFMARSTDEPVARPKARI